MSKIVAAILLGLPVILAQNNTCCQALQNAGLAHVLYPGSDEYANRTDSYWSISARLAPYCIVQPTSTSDVVKVINTLVQSASCGSTNFAVRSGGHTTWAGSNNINNGVTVDMGLMNNTSLDKNASIASIGAGARWGDVYGVLDPEGFTVPGGRAGSVGVAGFLSGGGNSFFTARKGFGCDNVKNFELVLASGEVVNANAEENQDLWQALKGGSGTNFGIVTRFDMFAFEARNLWGGTATYNKSTTAEHIAAYVKWTDNVNNYTDGSTIITWGYSPDMADIFILNVYEDTRGNEAPSGFDNFMAIPQISDTLRIDSHRGLVNEFGSPIEKRAIWSTMTLANDAEIMTKIIELHEAFVEEWKANNDPDFFTQWQFQSIPMIFSEHSVKKGGNVLGLDALNENVLLLLFNIAVKTAEEEVVARLHLRSYGEQMQKFAASKDGLIDWEYLNYADSYQDPLASYGSENVEKIRSVARKFDPEGIFQTRVPGGFKISKVGSETSADADEKMLDGNL